MSNYTTKITVIKWGKMHYHKLQQVTCFKYLVPTQYGSLAKLVNVHNCELKWYHVG